MAGERWAPETARPIGRRLVVEGTLVAQTLLHLGNGDGDQAVDMPLLRDEVDGSPLLTGASLAGALRGYLRARAYGYRTSRQKDHEVESDAVALFGGISGDPDVESAVVVADAHGRMPVGSGLEVRSGVRLELASRTAAAGALFDLEAWPAGTTFPLRLDLLLSGDGVRDSRLIRALATALDGLRPDLDGIALGARKRRGYGRVAVAGWTVTTYDLHMRDGLLAWLASDHESLSAVEHASGVTRREGHNLFDLLDVGATGDARRAFSMTMTCAVQGSLLVRGGSGTDARQDMPVNGQRSTVDSVPDIIHLDARQADGTHQPILPGTSLAGALRARATRIVNTIHAPLSMVDDIFGPSALTTRSDPLTDATTGDETQATPRASRLMVTEQAVKDATVDLIQNRVSIDRFTGGSLPGHLFDEQPLFARPTTTVTFSLRLIAPAQGGTDMKAEIGLLLLVLKDLWTGDLPLGGESSVGRGRLRGIEATMRLPGHDKPVTLREERADDEGRDDVSTRIILRGADHATLESYVEALKTKRITEGGLE